MGPNHSRTGTARSMHALQFTHHPALEGGGAYGFGWGRLKGQTVLQHDGGYVGVASRLLLLPESGLGLFIACNILDQTLINLVTTRLVDRLVPDAPPDTAAAPLPTPGTPHDPEVGEFAGTYRHTRYPHGSFEKIGVLAAGTAPEMEIEAGGDGLIRMMTLQGTKRRMIQIEPGLFSSLDDRYLCAFRRDSSGAVTHLFPNGATAFEKVPWWATVPVQRALFLTCMGIFAVVSTGIPLLERVRGRRVRPRLGERPVRRLAETTGSLFLYYLLGSGLVFGPLLPQEERITGFGSVTPPIGCGLYATSQRNPSGSAK